MAAAISDVKVLSVISTRNLVSSIFGNFYLAFIYGV
jgi:hypothetical protein